MKRYTTRIERLLFLALLCASVFAGTSILKTSASATSTINVYGRVFQDYNGNGIFDTGTAAAPAVDEGVAGVTVTAYDPNNVARGTTTTIGGSSSVKGTYNLSITGTGPYRIEFTNLPAGFFPSAAPMDSDLIATSGTSGNGASTVQFVPDATYQGINLAINRPSDYCQNNPLVCVAEHFQTSANVNGGALETFPYDYSSVMDGNLTGNWVTQPSRNALLAPKDIAFVNAIGSVYGVAWNPYANKVYTSAFVKRFVKLGALSGESTGAIYVKNNPASPLPAAALYVDLNAVFAGVAGANPHPASSTNWALDSAANAAVGKVGLGDLEISQDGSTLYVVNLNDRRLYTIPTSGPLNTSTIQSYPIPTTISLPASTCSTKDVRPFALGRDGGGRIYVGAVCSAESTGNPAFLQAYVWNFNTTTYQFTLVAANTLNYQRTYSSGVNNKPWAVGPNWLSPELILSDIEFDRGNMILGFRDKNGDEIAYSGAYSLGEILRACQGGSLGWTFENNGTCGGVGPTTGYLNNGLGGGEFYHEENGEQKGEGLLGALLQVPGFNHVMTTSFDAVAYNTSLTPTANYYTNGVQRYNNTTGTMNGAYDIYLSGQPGTFGKANGVGDIEALCDLAPIQLGNRIWKDTNGDGTQNSTEPPIAGVTVRLYNSSSVLMATAVTDANGEYYFSSAAGTNTANSIYGLAIQPNTAYQIRLDNPANYASTGPLAGLSLTVANAGSNDSIDSDAGLSGTFAVISLTTGGPGANDHTFDVGFKPPGENNECCDKMKVKPFWAPEVAMEYHTFEIYNQKQPPSDICSIDIDIRDSGGQPPPSGWQGGGLFVNNVPRTIGTWWKLPYNRIPNGTNGATVINGQFNSTSPAVQFNLGIDYSTPYTGTVTLVIHHCDGTVCTLTLKNWTPVPPRWLPWQPAIDFPIGFEQVLVPVTTHFPASREVRGRIKWIVVEAMDADTDIFSVDTDAASANDEEKNRMRISAAEKRGKIALYELAQPVTPETAVSGELNLVLRRKERSAAKPRLKYIFFDENASPIGFTTNEDVKPTTEK
jgi:hypothetical protein